MLNCAKCAKMCKIVPICAKPVQNVRNLPSYAQFGTVLHSLTYFGTGLHSSSHFSTLQNKHFSARDAFFIFCNSISDDVFETTGLTTCLLTLYDKVKKYHNTF